MRSFMVLMGIAAVLAAGLLGGPAKASAASGDIYISQTQLGNGSGSNCNNTHSAAWFNTPSSWGTGSGLIGPGTNVHLCGTFTGTAGSGPMLSFQAGGTSGNPITLVCASGANLTAPYWGFQNKGAIADNGYSYVTMNGSGCTIQDTANGTGLAYQQPSTAIYAVNASNVVIENFTIANICQHTSISDTVACGAGGNEDAAVFLTNLANSTVQGNTIHDTFVAVQYNCSGGSTDFNNTFTQNSIYHVDWGIAHGANGTGSPCANDTISYNAIHDLSNWDDNIDAFHHDPIFFYTGSGSPTVSGGQIYGNYIYGDVGADTSANIYVQLNGGTFPNLKIYNNLVVNGGNESNGNGNGWISSNSPADIWNNTVLCNNHGLAAFYILSSGVTLQNNVAVTCPIGIYLTSGKTISSDYNNWYNLTNSNGDGVMVGGTCTSSKSCNTLAAWTAATGQDTHSSIGNSLLSATYMLQSGSAEE